MACCCFQWPYSRCCDASRSSARRSPARTLLVGDTDHDAEVAEALGVRCLRIDSGHQKRARLEKSGAEIVDRI
ncbi:MAG: HAD family hydrolase [Myxococcales bacterium]